MGGPGLNVSISYPKCFYGDIILASKPAMLVVSRGYVVIVLLESLIWSIFFCDQKHEGTRFGPHQ